MDFAINYEICSPGVIAEDFDGDIVILNLENGRYFSLRGAGSIVWNALMLGATPLSIIDGASRRGEDWTIPVQQFLRRLDELRLIRAASEAPSLAAAQTFDWNTVPDGDQPAIDVFDDLAELILADPIHDVDAESGWPMRKSA